VSVCVRTSDCVRLCQIWNLPGFCVRLCQAAGNAGPADCATPDFARHQAQAMFFQVGWGWRGVTALFNTVLPAVGAEGCVNREAIVGRRSPRSIYCSPHPAALQIAPAARLREFCLYGFTPRDFHLQAVEEGYSGVWGEWREKAFPSCLLELQRFLGQWGTRYCPD